MEDSHLDGPEPIEIASRVVGHIFRKVPGAGKLSKLTEGKDKKSGLLTDIGVLLYSLIALNEDTIYEASEKAVVGIFTKEPKPNFDNGKVVDLGSINPSVVKNDHMTQED